MRTAHKMRPRRGTRACDMARLAYLVRFFRVVPPLPPLMTTTFAVLTAIVIAPMLLATPGHTPTLGPVLLLQAFAAASGFAASIRRGHYDLLLCRGEPRATVAVVHWVMSIVPGAFCWLIIASVERLLVTEASAVGFSTGGLAALTLASTLPWAVTVRLPRFAGAVGWLLVIAIGASQLPPAAATLVAGASATHAAAVATVVVLVNPAALLGSRPAPSSMVLAALAVAVVSMILALVWVHRSDIPLEAAQ